jgi:hypothetical protein
MVEHGIDATAGVVTVQSSAAAATAAGSAGALGGCGASQMVVAAVFPAPDVAPSQLPADIGGGRRKGLAPPAATPPVIEPHTT